MNTSTQSANPSPGNIATTAISIGDLVNALHNNLPNLATGKRYTLQELVGDDLWHAISPGVRKRLGQSFKELVNTSEQPVKWAGRRADNCQVYELT